MCAASAWLWPPAAADHDPLADLGRCQIADRQLGKIEAGEGLDEAEAGRLVVAEHVARDRAPVDKTEPDGLGLGDQVADGEHQPVAADDDAMAGPLGAEDRGGKGIVGDAGAETDHGRERPIEIEIEVFAARLHRRRQLPIGCSWHRQGFPVTSPPPPAISSPNG